MTLLRHVPPRLPGHYFEQHLTGPLRVPAILCATGVGRGGGSEPGVNASIIPIARPIMHGMEQEEMVDHTQGLVPWRGPGRPRQSIFGGEGGRPAPERTVKGSRPDPRTKTQPWLPREEDARRAQYRGLQWTPHPPPRLGVLTRELEAAFLGLHGVVTAVRCASLSPAQVPLSVLPRPGQRGVGALLRGVSA